MKLPYPPNWDVTPVVIQLSEGTINQQGVLTTTSTYTGKCNCEDRVITVRESDGAYTRHDGTVIRIRGDIAPTMPNLTGSVTLNGKTYSIVGSSRPKNPDGSVHHTKLELI